MSLHHLPKNPVSAVDQKRLDSFCRHLVANGFANGRHWEKGAGGEDLVSYDDPERYSVLAKIGCDRERGKVLVLNEDARQIAEGSVREIMTVVDGIVRVGSHR